MSEMDEMREKGERYEALVREIERKRAETVEIAGKFENDPTLHPWDNEYGFRLPITSAAKIGRALDILCMDAISRRDVQRLQSGDWLEHRTNLRMETYLPDGALLDTTLTVAEALGRHGREALGNLRFRLVDGDKERNFLTRESLAG